MRDSIDSSSSLIRHDVEMVFDYSSSLNRTPEGRRGMGDDLKKKTEIFCFNSSSPKEIVILKDDELATFPLGDTDSPGRLRLPLRCDCHVRYGTLERSPNGLKIVTSHRSAFETVLKY
jgi:hypothetical protein